MKSSNMASNKYNTSNLKLISKTVRKESGFTKQAKNMTGNKHGLQTAILTKQAKNMTGNKHGLQTANLIIF